MTLREAIALIQPHNYHPTEPSSWADLGCGTGLFTRALATLQPLGSIIYAIDTNQTALNSLTDLEGVSIKTICQDFVRDEWPFGALDGILMANSLHYVKNKSAFIEKTHSHLKKGGSFLLVECDTDTANPWVPYPLSYKSLKKLFTKSGYSSIEKLGEVPSIYRGGNIYSVSTKR